MNNKMMLLAAGALALGAAPAAMAQVSGSASITDFTYRLTDLAPDDGIAPSMTLRLIDANEYVAAYGNNRREGPPLGVDTHMGLGAAAAETVYGSARATVKTDLLRIALEGTYGSYFSGVNESWLLTLSPHTQVTFTASTDALLFEGLAPSDANANFEMRGSVKSDDTNDPASASVFHVFRYAQYGSTAGQLSASLFSEDHAVNGEIELYMMADARALAPIPEPPGWAMLVGGAALLALRRRIRPRDAHAGGVQAGA